jgi:hypothetical protein
MSVLLEVPFVTQLKPGFQDPTGCWYASACMLAYYFEAGPRMGVPELHTSNIDRALRQKLGFRGFFPTGSADASAMMSLFGGGQSEHDLLARREHLSAVDKCATNHSYTLGEIENYLRRSGPIFFYWTKKRGTETYGHASVIIGTVSESSSLIYHDPENLPKSSMRLANFHASRQTWKYALMQRHTPGSTIKARAKMFGG